MYPILLDYNGIMIPSWHVCFLIGAVFSYIVAHYFNRRLTAPFTVSGLDALYVMGYLGGYFGARLLSIFIEQRGLQMTVGRFLFALTQLGPMTFYGGFIGAGVLCLGYIFSKRLDIWDALDIGVPSLFVGLACGRIGCFFNGCDYGRVVALRLGEAPPWWSYQDPQLLDGLARYPTQLTESLVAFSLFVIGLLLFDMIRSRACRGGLGLLLLVSYGLARFFMEFLRGDERGTFVGTTLSTSQGISIILVVVASTFFMYRLLHKKQLASS